MEEQEKPSRKKLILFILLTIIIFVIVVTYIISRLSQPVSSNVESQQQKSSSISVYNIDLTPVPISGHYVSFNYPKGVSLVSTTLTSQPSVEDFTFFVKDIYSWTLAVDVIKSPTGSLSEDPSYTLRKNNPQTYSQSSETVSGQQVIIMTDNSFVGGFSKVAFLTQGVYIATVSLVGNDASGTGPLQTSFDMVVDSWHWL